MTTSNIEETEEIIRKAERRRAKIAAMRSLLDFLEENPIIPLPYFGTLNAFADTGEVSVADIARAMKPCDKSVSGDFYALSRIFGDSITFDVNFERDEVCERIVVGTEDVPEKVTPAFTKEIVEWVCPDSVLNNGDSQ